MARRSNRQRSQTRLRETDAELRPTVILSREWRPSSFSNSLKCGSGTWIVRFVVLHFRLSFATKSSFGASVNCVRSMSRTGRPPGLSPANHRQGKWARETIRMPLYGANWGGQRVHNFTPPQSLGLRTRGQGCCRRMVGSFTRSRKHRYQMLTTTMIWAEPMRG